MNFQYGRRGATLTSGTKTKAPVPYAKAKAAYDKLVAEKVGKGYSPSEESAVFTGTELEGRFTGIVPQLLNAVDQSQALALLYDDAWVMQEKHDGHRRALHNSGEESLGVNRKGLAVGMPSEVAADFATLDAFGPLTLDGELMGTSYAIFDVRQFKGEDVTGLPVQRRLEMLEQLRQALADSGASRKFFVTYTARTSQEKRALYEHLKATSAEGFVFKRLDAPYVPGRPASGGSQLKYKFVHSATVMVTRAHATRRSVAVHGFDANGRQVPLGNVTIPSNHDIPADGALVEVRYLYAYLGGSLYQPQYLGVRDDLDPEACTTAQLHYKRGTDEDLEDEFDAERQACAKSEDLSKE